MQESGIKWFPPRSKRDEEDMDAHPQPSTVIEMIHEKTKYIVGE